MSLHDFTCTKLTPVLSAGSILRSRGIQNTLFNPTRNGLLVLSGCSYTVVAGGTRERGDAVVKGNWAKASGYLWEDSFQSYNWDLPCLVTKDEVLQRYKEMQTMRRTEMPLIGQEAASGATAATPLLSNLAVIAGLLDRQAGISDGKGGSEPIFTYSFFGGNDASYAKLWNLPFIFVRENNKYGMLPPLRGVARMLRAISVVIRFLISRSAEDEVHSGSYPWVSKVPREWGVPSEQELKAIDKEAKIVVNAAVEKAESSPEPAVKDLWSDIYWR
ncbi:hypothetical protein BKA70DRAFT_1236493 [Coprinopsis sp. MPI-PUGE-AT-0042]|nr:hypothetical protein BKA70DRAFT_1236493 [Coprinopsis sp. MPI-PUGE-AT-0042]